jgi:3-hydroxyanthranilate 3,4-dioxygenase
MAVQAPFNFKKWIDDNRDLLKPPVGNKQIWTKAGDFIVMVVGGPNARKDFHYNESEEFFHQIEGDITVRIMEDGKPRDVEIKEGEIFLLPAKVPHSPMRGANTIGLVIEKVRGSEDKDGLQWYCEKCSNKLYEEYFPLTNIMTQFQEVFARFYGSEENRTCDKCGNVMEAPGEKTAART